MHLEHIKMIEELQNLSNELEFIDFLRRYFIDDFHELFNEELNEIENIRIIKNNYNGFKNDDIRRYTFLLFTVKIMGKKYKIDSYYAQLYFLKIIMFYESIINKIELQKGNDVLKKKIVEMLEVYSLVKDLISGKTINIGKHSNIINILGCSVNQGQFDKDEYHAFHKFFAGELMDKKLLPFIDEYKKYLKKR